ncbi:hypothetical protein G6F26_010039 [Rhizopus arrhizus]|nr:hypothetical protein G6F22_006475 [Rhizopus arrhizus]KAG1410704.1 hypothetical protein G6F58_008964 [Rhizopus delemar]KAG0807135.1 hypothetical protein G6F20_010589 [Rhizopus arrhizus]KAG0822523.1 hypothetical protein G6F19_011325 [Rhizopus arrhizus]KAG0824927.1 hypothetical protein G6F18_010649 [Rhizopus arrhizus]
MKDVSSKMQENPELAQAARDVAIHLTKVTQLLTELLDSTSTQTIGFNNKDKGKRKRDPDFPKQPTSNYLFYCNSIRADVDKEFPSANFVEKSKIYGERWKKLSDVEKKPYNEMAQKEKERYNRELETYEKNHGVIKKAKTEKAKPEVSPKKTTVKKEVAKDVKEEEAVSESSESESESDNSSGDSSSDEEEEETKESAFNEEEDQVKDSSSDDDNDKESDSGSGSGSGSDSSDEDSDSGSSDSSDEDSDKE